jgi:DNA-binding CsgD family transcriptional regulator
MSENERLRQRDVEYLRLVADGQNTKEIAYRLGISITTAWNFRKEICRKLGVCSTANLLRYAIWNGFGRPVSERRIPNEGGGK